jgi:hypothetical protein
VNESHTFWLFFLLVSDTILLAGIFACQVMARSRREDFSRYQREICEAVTPIAATVRSWVSAQKPRSWSDADDKLSPPTH